MLQHDEKQIDAQKPVPDTGPLMFLSLFLLLLAFFILLTAISTLEETKSRDVLSSLAATFKSDIIPDNTAEILVSTLGPVPEPEDVIEDLERLWLTAVPITRVDALTRGRTLQLSLPQTEVFVGGQPALRGDRQALLKATAFALAARLEGFSVQLHFTIPTENLEDVEIATAASPSVDGAADGESAGSAEGEDAQADAVDVIDALALLDPDTSEPLVGEGPSYAPNDLPFLRAARFAAAVVDAGAPPDGLSVGISERRNNRLRLRFEILDASQAQLTFSESVSGEAGAGEGGQ